MIMKCGDNNKKFKCVGGSFRIYLTFLQAPNSKDYCRQLIISTIRNHISQSISHSLYYYWIITVIQITYSYALKNAHIVLTVKYEEYMSKLTPILFIFYFTNCYRFMWYPLAYLILAQNCLFTKNLRISYTLWYIYSSAHNQSEIHCYSPFKFWQCLAFKSY